MTYKIEISNKLNTKHALNSHEMYIKPWVLAAPRGFQANTDLDTGIFLVLLTLKQNIEYYKKFGAF
jgi:hypothetical protein